MDKVFIETVYFGIVISLLTYWVATKIRKKFFCEKILWNQPKSRLSICQISQETRFKTCLLQSILHYAERTLHYFFPA